MYSINEHKHAAVLLRWHCPCAWVSLEKGRRGCRWGGCYLFCTAIENFVAGGHFKGIENYPSKQIAKVHGGWPQGLEKGADVEAEKANEATAPRLDVPDLRNLLNKRKDERLFSAARAGIVPAFLLGPPAGAVGGDAEGEPTEPPPGAPESREESMEDASESEDDSSSDSGDDDSSSDDD